MIRPAVAFALLLADMAPHCGQQYNRPYHEDPAGTWVPGPWGQCSNGVQDREVRCRSKSETVLRDSDCGVGTIKPPVSQSCTEAPLPPARSGAAQPLK